MRNKVLLVMALSISFASTYALANDQVLNSDPINVDGYLSEDRPVSDGELEQIKSEIRKQKTEVKLNKEKSKGFKELSKTTEKLSETTEEYIDEKKTAQKDIAEYNAKIKCLMEENPGKDCDKYVKNRRGNQVVQEVNTGMAAPAGTVASDLTGYGDRPFEEMKLIPYAGGTSFNGKVEQLEAELSGGINLESNITTRFSMGVGFNLAQLKTQDFANSGFGVPASYYQPNFYGPAGREIQYRSMGIDLYSKFFITKGERFRPYLGAGLGYNRANMKYTQNTPFQMGMNQFGDENYQTSFATAKLMAGSEIMITRGVGINIEGSYSTGLGNSLSSESSRNPFNSPDQRRLRDLGDEIINSNALSIFAGAVVIF